MAFSPRLWLFVITHTVQRVDAEALTSDWFGELQINDLSARRGESVCVRERLGKKSACTHI